MQNVLLQQLGDCSIRVDEFISICIISDHTNYAKTKVHYNLQHIDK